MDFRRDGKPVVDIDVPAVVSQFLSELSTFDLVVELVQNDLDAGATRTEISFLDDRIECVGNPTSGRSMENSGWPRRWPKDEVWFTATLRTIELGQTS